MAKKRKLPADPNERARRIVDLATSEEPTEKPNPDAAALGRRGGLKGGKARKKVLSPERRKEIARKAAAARWRAQRTR
jgi:hypothetical protein